MEACFAVSLIFLLFWVDVIGYIGLYSSVLRNKNIHGRSTGWSEYLNCCIFHPAFGCCTPQKLVKIVIFSVFCAKKLKKARNLQQNFAKNTFFWVCTKTLVDCFIPKKISFFHWNCIFWPAFWVRSTQTLVEIYNT